tara:strand:- start:1855 stop:1956 length:102 start_codon:yes stop_codon:yes gene_type:complete
MIEIAIISLLAGIAIGLYISSQVSSWIDKNTKK